MRGRVLPWVLILVCSAGTPALAASLDLSGCATRPTPSERSDCLAPFVSNPATRSAALAALEKLVEEDPAGVGGIASREAQKAEGPARARLLALRGRALLAQGKGAEAAEALAAALKIDDGTTRVRWYRGGASPAWTQSLDLGDRRIEWAARGSLAAGKTADAREHLARALALGASGWPADEGWRLAGGGPVPGIDAPAAPVLAPRWFEPLPDLHVQMLDGTDLPLRSARGKVLLLDFWASWCGPCLEELPHLTDIIRAEQPNGLMPLAVNAEEPREVARDAAASLGIQAPVALYNADIDRQFTVRMLPTVILIDRAGRIRARFDGYATGMEKSIAATVRQLLSDDPAGAPRKVGESVVGGGALEIAWSRDFQSSVGGIATVAAPGEKPSVAVTAEGQLITLDSAGAILRKLDAPASAGRLVAADLDGDGRTELLGFRTAGTEIAVFDLAQGRYRTVPARSPVLGVGLLGGKLVLATADGPQLSDTAGIEVTPVEGPKPASAVAVVAGEAVFVGPDGDLRFVDPSGRTLRKAQAPPDSFRLVAGDAAEGVGVAPPGAVAVATGRFLGGTARQAAFATAGQLVLLDVADGTVRVRLRWPGITDLAARDLDGDGADDLLVAWDRSVAVLRVAGRPRG